MKLTIDWDKAPKWAMFFAIGPTGIGMYYDEKPYVCLANHDWLPSTFRSYDEYEAMFYGWSPALQNYPEEINPAIDWIDTLQERPRQHHG